MPARWFPDTTIRNAMASLHGEIGRIDSSLKATGGAPPPKADDTQKMVFGLVAIVVVMLALLVGVLMMFGDRDPEHEFTASSVITLVSILVGLPLAVFVWAKFFYGVRAQRVRERDLAFRQISDQVETLSFGGFTKISGESVGMVPWLATELDTIVECDLYGEYRGQQVAVLECTYVVDMTLSTIEASIGKVGAAVMSRIQHEQVRRRMLEAYVFFRSNPNLPDMLWAPTKQPLNWYFKRQFDVQPVRTKPDCLLTSDPAACQSLLTPAVQQQFLARPDCIVQVLGGYVVLVPQTWDWNRPAEMPCDQQQIQANLDWACGLYEALSGAQINDPTLAPASTLGADSMPASNSVETPSVASSTVPSSTSAQPSQRPRSWAKILAAVAGIGLIGFGLLVFAAMMWMSMKASNAANWPTVEGRMVTSDVGVDGSRFFADLEYTYEVNGEEYRGKTLAVGGRESDRDRAVVEAVIAKYPTDSAVTVYYNASRPDDAVLEPRLTMQGAHTCSLVCSGIMGLFGILFVYWGFRKSA